MDTTFEAMARSRDELFEKDTERPSLVRLPALSHELPKLPFVQRAAHFVPTQSRRFEIANANGCRFGRVRHAGESLDTQAFTHIVASMP
jgi:hypothetical protein